MLAEQNRETQEKKLSEQYRTESILNEQGLDLFLKIAK